MVVKNKAYFEGHMTGHSKAKDHHCSFCSKSFKTKIQLDIHESRHTGQGKYECSICGKRFPQKGEVKNHEMQHGSEKGYTCDLCGKSFTRDAYLRIHMKTHQKKEEPYEKEKGYDIIYYVNPKLYLFLMISIMYWAIFNNLFMRFHDKLILDEVLSQISIIV